MGLGTAAALGQLGLRMLMIKKLVWGSCCAGAWGGQGWRLAHELVVKLLAVMCRLRRRR